MGFERILRFKCDVCGKVEVFELDHLMCSSDFSFSEYADYELKLPDGWQEIHTKTGKGEQSDITTHVLYCDGCPAVTLM